MSPERTMQAQRASGARLAAEARYMEAARVLALREAEFFALDTAGAGAAAKLACMNEREKAAKALAEAERGVIGTLWADATLTNELRIGEAVRAVLEALREEAIALPVD